MKSMRVENMIRKGGSNRHERHYLEFIISGQSLGEILGIDNFDLVTPLGWGDNKEYERGLLQILTLRKKSDMESGRIILYVCPECGDIECGAITAKILDLGDRIVWKDFAYAAGFGVTEEYNNIEPIEIDRQSYFQAFSKL